MRTSSRRATAGRGDRRLRDGGGRAHAQQNVGVYLTDTFDVTERLALTAGRYQYVASNPRQERRQPGAGRRPPLRPLQPRRRNDVPAAPRLRCSRRTARGFARPPGGADLRRPGGAVQPAQRVRRGSGARPVVARTYEFGARGAAGPRVEPRAVPHELQDDILFTAIQTGGAGFFRNVDLTRRQGIEAGVSGEWKRLRYSVSYGFVDATYQSGETLASVTVADGARSGPATGSPGSRSTISSSAPRSRS